MHGGWTFTLFLLCIPQIFGAPAMIPSISPHVTFQAPNHSGTNAQTLSTHHHLSTHTFPPFGIPTFTPSGTPTSPPHHPPGFVPHPFGTLTPPPFPTFTPDSIPGNSSDQTPIVIFFEVICGIVAIAIFLFLIRFFHSYRKTPDPDRVLGIISRYRLQVELEDLHRRPTTRRTSIREPAPPYVPRPPSYGEFPSVDHLADHSQVRDESPITPSPPPMAQIEHGVSLPASILPNG